MDTAHRDALIDRYAAGVAAVERALDGASDEELDRFPPGGWSARMVVHHLADSEANSYIRLRKLLAEDRPEIQGYDEATFARVLHYDRPIATSFAVFAAVRASTGDLLQRLGPDDWARAGTHSQSGPYTMDDWLEIYAGHAVDHADQIVHARDGRA